jgi:hypothetical protein
MAEQLSPWASARANAPGYGVIRIIDLERNTDRFQILRPRREDTCEMVAAGECHDQLLDGTTLIKSGDGIERSSAEIAAIINQYDEAWRARQAGDIRPQEAGADHGRDHTR